MIYKNQPSDFNKEIDIVACYVQHNDMIILLHRHIHKINGDTWGLPAGKVEEGESIHQAMNREIFEETGIHISEDNLEYFDSIFVRNNEHDFEYHMFSTKLSSKPEVKINANEHKDFMWVSPNKALKMDLIHDLDECIKMFYV